MDAGKKNSEPVINDLPWADALFLLDPRGVCMECVSEAKTKTKQTFTESKNFTLFKKLFSLLKSFENNAKNRSTKGTPLQVLAFAIKNWN